METYKYARIQKLEFSAIIKGTNVILGKYNTEALDISIWCDLLMDQESELSSIKEVNRVHPAVKELNKYRKKRRALLSIISTSSATLERAEVDQLTARQAVVVPFLKTYVRNLFAENLIKTEEKVDQMLQAIEENAALKTALQEVGMKDYFDELKVIQNNIALIKSEIVKFKSEIPKMRTVAIKNSGVEALNNLITSINLGIIKNPALDYTPLVNELDAFLGGFRMLDKSRRTVSIRTAENKKTVASSTTTSATVN